MEVDLMTALGAMVAALVAQLTKAEGWNPWFKRGYAAILATLSTWISQGEVNVQVAGVAVAIALAFHSVVMSDTAVGGTLKWDILGKIGKLFSTLLPAEPPKPG